MPDHSLPRFVRFPVAVTNRKLQDDMGINEWTDTYMKVNADFIMNYMPSAYERDGDTIPCVAMWVGSSILTITLSIREVEAIINMLTVNQV